MNADNMRINSMIPIMAALKGARTATTVSANANKPSLQSSGPRGSRGDAVVTLKRSNHVQTTMNSDCRVHLKRSVNTLVRRLAVVLLACGGAGFTAQPAAAQFPAPSKFLDEFNDNFINPLTWSAYTGGYGPQILATNQRVEMHVPFDSAGPEFFATVQGAFLLKGDYDFQVDFELLEFPYSNGLRVGLGAHFAGVVVERTSLAPGDFEGFPTREVYLTDGFGGVQGMTGTSDNSGMLRQVRMGVWISSYYWDAASAQWVELSTVEASDADAIPFFSVWSADGTFGGWQVRVAFDNFKVNSGTFWGEPWNIVSVLGGVIDYEVADGGVAPEILPSLHAKVDAALAALAAGNPNAAKVAMNDLAALVRQVEAQIDNQITIEAARAIIGQANWVISVLGP